MSTDSLDFSCSALDLIPLFFGEIEKNPCPYAGEAQAARQETSLG